MVGVYRIHEAGGPEVMRWEEEDLGSPAPGMAEVQHTAIGLNYIDTYHRSGLYQLPLPTRLGVEGAGVVAAVTISRSAFPNRQGVARWCRRAGNGIQARELC